jgi:hypothetical protein
VFSQNLFKLINKLKVFIHRGQSLLSKYEISVIFSIGLYLSPFKYLIRFLNKVQLSFALKRLFEI